MDHFNIFYIENEKDLTEVSLEVFHHQYEQCGIYRRFCDLLGISVASVKNYRAIPFLPVSFFKTHDVVSGCSSAEKIFFSSGTTGMDRSRHLVTDLGIYHASLRKGFEYFYGPLSEYDIFGLMPSPEENPGSSLIFMTGEWIRESGSEVSGFFLNDEERLIRLLQETRPGRKKLLIGLSYALLDLAEQYPVPLENVIIMETGGMKGRRKELVRQELHETLCRAFSLEKIHSEYGMTELLSQAYSEGNGIFRTPPWMKILIRDMDDPLTLAAEGKTGGINVIDLANINSCSFLALQDLGKVKEDGSFEVLGRFDDSDVRGCNLMIT